MEHDYSPTDEEIYWQGCYKLIIESVKLLSREYEDQKDLWGLGEGIPGELLESFDDHYNLGLQLISAQFITDKLLAILNEIDQKFSEMLKREEEKSLSLHALKHAQEWEDVRNLAKSVLAEAKEENMELQPTWNREIIIQEIIERKKKGTLK